MAWHLGRQFQKAGVEILQIYNRTDSAARNLAKELNTQWTNVPSEILHNADLYVMAVSDDAIGDVLNDVVFNESNLLVHTAGSVDMEVLKKCSFNYGVLYPLQTLTKGKPVNFENLPILIEANNEENLETIRLLSLRISGKVIALSSEKRRFLHLAAVISSNFTNHFLALSSSILNDQQIPFELLKPLLHETVEKAFEIGPVKAQTGPAVRGNERVMRKHIELLEHYPQIQELYRLISDHIYASAKK
jgi:predicted short-subunit dehydrogenase-like oxidoreductase (DUF2520 family)